MSSDGVDEAKLFEETSLLAITLSREYVIENKMVRREEFSKLLEKMVAKGTLKRDQGRIKVSSNPPTQSDLDPR